MGSDPFQAIELSIGKDFRERVEGQFPEDHEVMILEDLEATPYDFGHVYTLDPKRAAESRVRGKRKAAMKVKGKKK